MSTSMEYLDTVMENAEYVDTLKGKLPLAEAARMIAQDQSKRAELFTQSHVRKFEIQCYKRLVCIGFGFACLYASFFCLRNLQSSNSGADPTLGLITFGCLSLLVWLGDLLSIQVIYYIRPKWCLVLASTPFILYAGANFYPSKFTLIPSALLFGLGQGMLWSSEGIYMINLSANYAMVSRKSLLEVIGKFNSVIFGMHMTSGFIGNIIGFVILSNGNKHSQAFDRDLPNNQSHISPAATNVTSTDGPYLSGNSTELICGLDFYLSNAEQPAISMDEIDPVQRFILIGVVSGLALIGCMNFIFLLQPLKTVKITGNNSFIKNFGSFLNMFTKPKIWLILPLMLFPGIANSVFVADFTKVWILSYINYGIHLQIT